MKGKLSLLLSSIDMEKSIDKINNNEREYATKKKTISIGTLNSNNSTNEEENCVDSTSIDAESCIYSDTSQSDEDSILQKEIKFVKEKKQNKNSLLKKKMIQNKKRQNFKRQPTM